MNPNCGTAPKGGAIKKYELALFLLTRLSWTQNSFIILISKIRCVFFTHVFCSKNVYFSKNVIEKPLPHLRNTTLNSTWNSSGNQHSGSFVSKNRTAKAQYGIKGNFFVNHLSFIINSVNIYISSVSVLDYKCLIFPEFQRFLRYMLWRKPLNNLRNMCFAFSGCCVLINRHFDHMNEAAVQVYKWNIFP